MTIGEMLEIEFPLMRYDITMPLLDGRVTIDGVKLKPVKSSSMISTEDLKLKQGEFGLCDLNIGYWLPAMEAGTIRRPRVAASTSARRPRGTPSASRGPGLPAR